MTAEEIQLDLEVALVLDNKPIQQCEQCKGWSAFDHCPVCPDAKPMDRYDEMVAREERGEKVDWAAYDQEVWGALDSVKQGSPSV